MRSLRGIQPFSEMSRSYFSREVSKGRAKPPSIAGIGWNYHLVRSRAMHCPSQLTEGVRAAVKACVEKSTNSEGRIVEVNAFGDFFSKALGKKKSLNRCIHKAGNDTQPYVKRY